jgi:hypothetical protein
MKLSQRDKLVVLLLPALVICAVYGWYFFPPKYAAWKAAHNAMADAHNKAPALQDKVLLTQAKVALANRQLQSLESDKQRAYQAWNQAAAHCTDPGMRNERIEKLNSLLARHGLRVIEDTEAEAGKDGKVAPAVEGLCKELASMSAQLKPQLRKVRMLGPYLDVVAALDDLATREVVAIPVGLMMKEAHLNDARREWVLLVWI